MFENYFLSAVIFFSLKFLPSKISVVTSKIVYLTIEKDPFFFFIFERVKDTSQNFWKQILVSVLKNLFIWMCLSRLSPPPSPPYFFPSLSYTHTHTHTHTHMHSCWCDIISSPDFTLIVARYIYRRLWT